MIKYFIGLYGQHLEPRSITINVLMDESLLLSVSSVCVALVT